MSVLNKTLCGNHSLYRICKNPYNAYATLFGDKNHIMKCRFGTNGKSLAAGGKGVCEVSDGRVIDVEF